MALIVTMSFGISATGGVAHADPSVADLDRQLASANERLEILVEQRNGVQADLDATQVRRRAGNSRIEALTAQLATSRQEVGRVAVWAYQSGPSATFSAAISAGSPGEFLGRLAALEALGQTAHGQVTGLAGLLLELREQRSSLESLVHIQQEQRDSVATLTAEVEADIAHLRELRTRAVAAAPSIATPATSRPAVSVAASGVAAVALEFAYAQLGKGYRYGAAGPDAYDCSGLTMAAWEAAGVALPHNAARQFSSVPRVSRAELVPGDLVFYYSDIHHVAMYVGDGMVIHAPNYGETVRVQAMQMGPIAGYGRP